MTQAEAELLAGLAITYPGFAPASGAIRMNVAGGDSDDNAYLLAVSSVLIQVAVLRGGSLDARVQKRVNGLALVCVGGDVPGVTGTCRQPAAAGEACDPSLICAVSSSCGDGLGSCCLPAGDLGHTKSN